MTEFPGPPGENPGAGRTDPAPLDEGAGLVVGWLNDGMVPELGRFPAVPVEGRVATEPVEGVGRISGLGWMDDRTEPALQPRASMVLTAVATPDEPLVCSRPGSGCQRWEV